MLFTYCAYIENSISNFYKENKNGNKRHQLSPYPKQYSTWGTERCSLLEQLSGILRSIGFPTGWVTFRVRVPGASKVAVIVKDAKNNFRQMTNSNGEWYVQVHLLEYFGKNEKYQLNVSAVLPSTKCDSYWSLLEY